MEGSLSTSRDLLHRLSRRYLRVSSLLALAVIVLTAAAAALYGSGRLDARAGGYLLLFPFLILAVAKPAWLVIALVAIPQAVSNAGSITGLTIALGFALVVHNGRQGRVSVGVTSGLLPVIVLLVMSHLFPAELGDIATSARENFLKNVTYYVTLAMLSFSLVRTGHLTVRQLVPALLIGIGGTALLLLAVGGSSSLMERSSLDPGLGLGLQSHFGYLSAMAFIASFAWAVVDEDDGVDRSIRWMIVAFFATTTAVALVRGAWLAAIIGVFVVSRRAGKVGYLWSLPFVMTILLLLPVARDRLVGEFSQRGVAESFASGQAGTGRWGLWARLYDEAKAEPVTGHGSGFAFTLDSQALFGFEGQFAAVQNTFVYPHNEFLFWMLDFGLIGAALYVAFWLALAASYRLLIVHPEEAVRRDALLLAGVLITMFIAGLVANGLFIRPLADRFFIAAGALFALRRLHRTGGRA